MDNYCMYEEEEDDFDEESKEFDGVSIDKEGRVTGAKARAPHPDLETETLRVINSLPQFTPGQMNGKAVTANYSLPILFQVAAKTNQDKKN